MPEHRIRGGHRESRSELALTDPHMTQVYPRLYVGWHFAYDLGIRHLDGWYVVHACKEPYHRDAVGYETEDPPPDHPERLVARRGHRLMLNLLDAADPIPMPREVFDAALAFIHEGLTAGCPVLVHCEAGMSRSPAIALLYLARHTTALPTASYEDAEERFTELYPDYSPGPAIRRFLIDHWTAYARPTDGQA
jgi:hypothetical protein